MQHMIMANVCGVPYYIRFTDYNKKQFELRGLKDHGTAFSSEMNAKSALNGIEHLSKNPLSVIPVHQKIKNAV